MSRIAVVCVGCALLTASSAEAAPRRIPPGVARASTRAAASPFAYGQQAPSDDGSRTRSSVDHRVALTLNPLPFAIGRFGANVEVLVVPHHALVGSVFVQTFSEGMLRTLLPNLPLSAVPSAKLGGELGYRFYSGETGPSGFFVGPSFVTMPLAAPRLTEQLTAEIVSFDAYGGAIDLGVQAIVGPGFTIGGGIGVMALAYRTPVSAPIPPEAGVTLPSYPEPHVLPRLLLSAGWAF